MTPDALVTQARSAYNAVGDSFFSAQELYNVIWDAEQMLAIETRCIESASSTTTVVGQHEYAKPSTCLSVRRVTYNGQNLIPINFMEDDAVTGFSAATTDTGTPTYYYEWQDSLFLRPIPNDTQTLKLWFFANPQQISASASLDIPVNYQLKLVDPLLAYMFGKDGKEDMAAFHQAKWVGSINQVRIWEAKKRRNNRAAAVNNLDAFSELSTIV